MYVYLYFYLLAFGLFFYFWSKIELCNIFNANGKAF